MAERTEGGRLYERIARDLAAKIAGGEYPIGDRLPAERNLANTYSVSRPTIREAIIALELDGLVDVRIGSGVYVAATTPTGGQAGTWDVGPFELLEARRAIEGESCALAATQIDEAQLAELRALIEEMRSPDISKSEDADRRFHLGIAAATGNSAMVAAVEMLWDARERSRQYRLLTDKAHEAGIFPPFAEHQQILDALVRHDPDEARAAMRNHLTIVLEAILKATEVHEVELARARVAAQRQRFASA